MDISTRNQWFPHSKANSRKKMWMAMIVVQFIEKFLMDFIIKYSHLNMRVSSICTGEMILLK